MENLKNQYVLTPSVNIKGTEQERFRERENIAKMETKDRMLGK